MFNLDQDRFMSDFVATYLATWAANRDSQVWDGKPSEPVHPPVQRAVMAARVAWYSLIMSFDIAPRKIGE